MPEPHLSIRAHYAITVADDISCEWLTLRDQLLKQWKRLTRKELDSVGPKRRSIAALIERKYGIAAVLVENYLQNFERTMPLALAPKGTLSVAWNA